MNVNKSKIREVERGVFETRDYDLFRFKGPGANRNIDPRKIEEKVATISNFGQLTPIEVNEKFEIIEGQHRFLALKRLGLPVQYRVTKDKTPEELAEMNRATSKWTSMDYIGTMAQAGNETFKYIDCLIKEFGDLSIQTISKALRINVTPARLMNAHVDAQDYDRAREVLYNVKRIWSKISHAENVNYKHLHAITSVIARDVVDPIFLEQNLLRNDNYQLLKSFTKEIDIVQNIEDVCNKGLRNKVFFVSQFKASVWQKKAAYKADWRKRGEAEL